MQTIYADQHAGHHPELEFFEGELKHYHDTPDRPRIILDALQATGLGAVVSPVDHGLAPILAVHDADYIDYLQRAYADWIAEGGIPAGVYPDTFPVRRSTHRPTKLSALAGYYSMDLTAVITQGTWQAAYWSAQCALTAAQHVQAGERACFALCRPPGHHAAQDLCGGYCFLNNAAVAAQLLASDSLASGSLASGPPASGSLATDSPASARVAILDIDFHHGNGTQTIFYNRSDVLYVSLHADPDRQYPYFLGTASERGEGEGEGYNVNYPLVKGIDDRQYLAALDQALGCVRKTDPRYLVVSLGVDTFSGDPLGDFNLTSDAYPRIGRLIAQLNLPTVFIMEGGYAIQELGRHVAGVLGGFQSVYNGQ